jgi:hypothetical protein
VVFPPDANATFQDIVHEGMLISLDMGGAMIMETERVIAYVRANARGQAA